MLQAADQFRPSDVTFWGVIALVCGAVAVLSANVSAVLPEGVLAGLHSTRIEGANMSQVRAQLTALQAETVRLRREATALQSRFALKEEGDGEITRRVGALEVSIPKLLEALPAGAEIDRTNLTASIPNGAVTIYDADGGSVAVTQKPMQIGATPLDQPLPDPIPNPMAFGLALGPEVAADAAPAQWQATVAGVEGMLNGLGALLADQSESSAKRIVAGPVDDPDQAQALCNAMIERDVECMLVPFTGNPL